VYIRIARHDAQRIEIGVHLRSSVAFKMCRITRPLAGISGMLSAAFLCGLCVPLRPLREIVFSAFSGGPA
jgi:hypothetical protein